MSGLSCPTRVKKLHRFSPEVLSPSQAIENESSDEDAVGKKYNENTVGGSSNKVQFGDTFNTFRFYPAIQQRLEEGPLRTRPHEMLLDAVKTNQDWRVERALGPEVKANIDHRFHDELTALHIAVWYGHLNCVDLLVKKGADVNATSFKYGTPLCVAAFRGNLRMVDALLDTYRARIDADGGWLGSPTHAACLRQSIIDGPVEKRLLRKVLKLGGARCGSKKVNLEFWKHHREDPSAPEAFEHYFEGHPIHIASYFGQRDAVDCMLAAGANIDSLARRSMPNEDCCAELRNVTALMLASMPESNVETLATLLRKGACADLQDSKGYTALLHAAEFNSARRVATLIEYGCDKEARSEEGFTALTLAARGGHFAAFGALVVSGAKIFAIDANGLTATRHAYQNGQLPALIANITLAICIASGTWFAFGLGWAFNMLSDGFRKLEDSAAYFEQRRAASASHKAIETAEEPTTCLDHLLQLTEKGNSFLQYMAERVRQDRKPRFALNDAVLSFSLLSVAPCLMPILILKWESDRTTLPWAMTAFYMLNKIRSLLSEIQAFLREFESSIVQEKPSAATDDPG